MSKKKRIRKRDLELGLTEEMWKKRETKPGITKKGWKDFLKHKKVEFFSLTAWKDKRDGKDIGVPKRRVRRKKFKYWPMSINPKLPSPRDRTKNWSSFINKFIKKRKLTNEQLGLFLSQLRSIKSKLGLPYKTENIIKDAIDERKIIYDEKSIKFLKELCKGTKPDVWPKELYYFIKNELLPNVKK